MSYSGKVLVCGSRHLGSYEHFRWNLISYEEYLKQRYFITNTLDKIFFEREWIYSHEDGNWLPTVTIIHGGAQGVDSIADEYAVLNWCRMIIYKADWDKYGKSAGPIRNKQMLEEGKPDLVVAFFRNSKNKSKGTSHMVKIAREAGVEVLEYCYE